MEIEQKIAEILEVCSKLGLEVRAERLGGSGGGICRLKTKTIAFVDLDADPESRYEKLLTGLSTFKEIDDLYLLPEIRSDLERIGSGDRESG